MRLGWLLVVAACGTEPAARSAQLPQTVARLPAPPPIDAEARGATYLTAVALTLQPAWHQFLEDCRLRLPPNHPLNNQTLSAIVELEIGKRGEVVGFRIATSGNVDFDRAIEQVIADGAPLSPPPRELWSDDDHVHLAWTFARDRRQAGPATAQIVDVELPLRGVVDRRIGERDLSSAARRILRAKPSPDREIATQRLMIAALREALDSSDGAVRRSALDAIARAQATELAMDVRQLLAATSDIELRIAATQTSAALHDEAAVSILVEQLRVDLREQPRLALAEARALVAIGHDRSVAPFLAGHLDANAPNPTALQALALAPLSELAQRLSIWMRSGHVRTRAAVCSALAGYPDDVAWPLLVRGLRDPDATVRATCVESSAAARPPSKQASAAQRTAVSRLRELARDRDSAVRARTMTALALLDPAHLPDASNDASADVRAAYAAALAAPRLRDANVRLRALIEDRDPEVRAAAWTSLAAATLDTGRSALAVEAAADAAPSVRRAAVTAIDDDELLLRLSKTDEAAEVRTAALIRLAGRRGRAAIADQLVERVADTTPRSAERVRGALAWLLAR